MDNINPNKFQLGDRTYMENTSLGIKLTQYPLTGNGEEIIILLPNEELANLFKYVGVSRRLMIQISEGNFGVLL